MSKKEEEEENEDDDDDEASPPPYLRTRRCRIIEKNPLQQMVAKKQSPLFVLGDTPITRSALSFNKRDEIGGERGGKGGGWEEKEDEGEDEEDEEESPSIKIRSRRCGIVENISIATKGSPLATTSTKPNPLTTSSLSQVLEGVSPSHRILDTEGKPRPISVIITDHSVKDKKLQMNSCSADSERSGQSCESDNNSNESNSSNYSSPFRHGDDEATPTSFQFSDTSDDLFQTSGEDVEGEVSLPRVTMPRPRPQTSRLNSAPYNSSNTSSSSLKYNQQHRLDDFSLSQSLLSVISPRMRRKSVYNNHVPAKQPVATGNGSATAINRKKNRSPKKNQK